MYFHKINIIAVNFVPIFILLFFNYKQTVPLSHFVRLTPMTSPVAIIVLFRGYEVIMTPIMR